MLVGPLELVFSAPGAPPDAPAPALALPPLLPGGPGAGGRLVLGAGAAVAVTGVRGVRLARPLDLPPPPAAYLERMWGGAAPADPSSLDGTRP